MTAIENKFYVYGHYTLDTNELFYIGKGCGKRAYEKGKKRSQCWNRIAQKHGHRVEIFMNGLDEGRALIQEILGIKECKPIANLSFGGVGVAGYKRSKEDRENISKRMMGKNNPRYNKLGTMLGKKMPVAGIEKLKILVYNKRKGKSLKEIYGCEKAQAIIEKSKGKIPWNRGKIWNLAFREKLSKVHGIDCIYVYNKNDMSLVGMWNNMTKCSEDLGVNQSVISRWLKGRNQFHKRNKCIYFFSRQEILCHKV